MINNYLDNSTKTACNTYLKIFISYKSIKFPIINQKCKIDL